MKLKEIRTKKGLTQEELGQSCGISRQRITNYEIGIREPDIETLKNLASVLECTVDELLEDHDESDYLHHQ